jgi:hypothetical protein
MDKFDDYVGKKVQVVFFSTKCSGRSKAKEFQLLERVDDFFKLCDDRKRVTYYSSSAIKSMKLIHDKKNI